MAEAFVWAATDAHLGVCISTRAFGSMDDAKRDAQECIGDACPVEWNEEQGGSMALGDFVDTEGRRGHVTVALVKVSL